jgi:diaminopimelate epimerase
MRFRKYHAIGNDNLVLEADSATVTPTLVRWVCHRHRGVGGDGVLVEVPVTDADAGVRIVNLDGTEAETSGNGVRIFARYLHDAGDVAAPLGAGFPDGWRFTAVSMGNPHAVVHVDVA